MNCCGWSRGDSGEEHEHQSDAVLESVMVFRLAAGAVAEVVVPLGLAKAALYILRTQYSTPPSDSMIPWYLRLLI